MDTAISIYMRVVILGSTGFIGSNIMNSLLQDGSFLVTGLSSSDIDLCDKEETLSKLPCLLRDSVIIVTSANTLDKGDSIDTMMKNIKMYSNIASSVMLTHPAHIIYLSSVDVYGQMGLDLPLNEFSRLNPSTFYAISKLAGEYIFNSVSINNGIPYTILRLPRVYGTDDTHSAISKFILSALKSETIRVNSDGSQLRDFVYVKDISKLVKLITARKVTGTYNLVIGRSYSINDILGFVKRLCNPSAQVIYDKEKTDYNLVFEEPAILKVTPDFSFTDFETAVEETAHVLKETYKC